MLHEEKSVGVPRITFGRQCKRGRRKGKTMSELETGSIKKRTLQAFMLDSKVLKAEYHREEKQVMADGNVILPSIVLTADAFNSPETYCAQTASAPSQHLGYWDVAKMVEHGGRNVWS